MRLIDADEFMNYVRKNCKDSLADLWCELIRRQTTAFDLDKVIEHIRKATDEYGLVDYVNDKPMITKEQAIEIVEKGWIK